MSTTNLGPDSTEAHIKVGTPVPGEVFLDEKERKVLVSYSHGKGHEGICGIEACYALSPEAKKLAGSIAPLGYAFVGMRNTDGTLSAHAATMMENHPDAAAEAVFMKQPEGLFWKDDARPQHQPEGAEYIFLRVFAETSSNRKFSERVRDVIG